MQLLLAGYDDLKIGACLGEIVECDAGDGAGGGGEADVDARFLEGGMREKDENAGGRGHIGERSRGRPPRQKGR